MRKAVLMLCAVTMAALFGCAERVAVPASPSLPAATGVAKSSKDGNGNTQVTLKVQHVAPPQNLQPPKSVYVVWVETPDNQRYNFGQLKIGENREGSITGITPFQVFRLIITAEDYPTVTQPSSQTLLTTNVVQGR